MLARLEADLKTAMKSGDKRRVATLRLLLAGLKNEKIQAQRESSDEEVEAVLRRAVKQRKESSIQQYWKGGTPGPRRRLKTQELAILEGYLPKGLTDAEIESTLRAVIAETRLHRPEGRRPGDEGALPGAPSRQGGRKPRPG